MEKYKIEVEAGHAGKRLDKFLAEMFPRPVTRTFVKKLVDEEAVLVNGKPSKCHHRVALGEDIEVIVPEPHKLDITPKEIPLDILYEDEHLIVVNKPAGLSVHPGAGNYTDTLVNALLHHCRNLSGIGGALRPGIVHRLDKDTSGVMVVAKSDIAHDQLSRQFKNRTVGRTYIALAKGVVQLDNGIIEAPIGRHNLHRQKMAVKFAEGKKAITRYKVLERFKDFTMLELNLSTGRTHQIRVHLSYMGNPLLGEKKYGSPKGMARHALHAKTLEFTHPVLKKRMRFDSEIPGDMKEVMRRGYI